MFLSYNVNLIDMAYSLKFVTKEHTLTVLFALPTIYCTSEQKRNSFAVASPHGFKLSVSVAEPIEHCMRFQPVTAASLS